MRQKLLVDIGGTLELKYYEHSIQIKPTSAKITIYDNDGTEKVAETAASIDAAGTMTYIVQPTITDNTYYSWKAMWQFVVGGITKYKSKLFDVVNQVLENPVVDKDIIDYAQFLKNKNYRVVITADSGSSTEIVSTELNEDNDYWNGGTAEVIEGTNVGQIRKITDFDASANKITVEAFTAAITASSKCVIIRTYKNEIDQAFNRFKLDMKNRDIFIDQIIDSDQVKEYIIILALHFICLNFSTDVTDIWFTKAEIYEKDYNGLINVAVFDYDSNDDGNIEEDEKKDSIFQLEGVR